MEGRQRVRQRSRRHHMRVAGALAPLAPSAAAAATPLEAVFDASPVPMCICDAASGRFLAVNDAALELYGYLRADLLARRLDEIEIETPAAPAALRRHRAASGAVLQIEASVQALDYAGREAQLMVLRDVTVQRRAIGAMEANEHRFRDLFERGLGLVCTHDLDGVLLSINPAAAEALGYRVGELIGRSLSELLVPELRDSFDAYLERVAQGEASGVLHVLHKSGQPLIWNYRNRVLHDAHGEPYVMGHAEDVTERRQYEQRLQEQQAELEAVTDNSPIGLFRADLDGGFVYVNRTFERIVGRRADEAMGAGWLNALHPADRARVAAQWRDAVATRASFISLHRFRPSAGQTVWTSMRAQPLIVKGEVAGYVGSFADVTARQVAERQLARSEQRLRTIADAVPAMIAYVDAQQRFIFVNAAYAHHVGREPREIVGRSGREILGEALYARRRPYIERALRGERVLFEEEQQAGSEYRCYEITYIPQFEQDTHEVLGLHAMVQDITRKALQERGWMRAAELDPLTGVANRAGFLTRLTHALARCRDQQGTLALMYLDIDHFKHINDTYGHGVGDAVIQAFAQRLGSILRPSDIVGRLGGDEFTVAIEGVRRPQYAAVVAAKIVSAMRRPFVLEQENLTLQLSASVGLALCDGTAELAATELLKRADGALYQAKAAGRDGYRMVAENGAAAPAAGALSTEVLDD